MLAFDLARMVQKEQGYRGDEMSKREFRTATDVTLYWALAISMLVVVALGCYTATATSLDPITRENLVRARFFAWGVAFIPWIFVTARNIRWILESLLTVKK
jgi:hypothetical protein